jgi:predicted dinucleotide-binding enzyme
MTKVAFLGIGLMGASFATTRLRGNNMHKDTSNCCVRMLHAAWAGNKMARRLAAQGFHVTAWNRTASKAQALADAGIACAACPADAIAGSDVVILMLADYASIQSTLVEDPAAQATLPGKTIVQMGTIGACMQRQAMVLPTSQPAAHMTTCVPRGHGGPELIASYHTAAALQGQTRAACLQKRSARLEQATSKLLSLAVSPSLRRAPCRSW